MNLGLNVLDSRPAVGRWKMDHRRMDHQCLLHFHRRILRPNRSPAQGLWHQAGAVQYRVCFKFWEILKMEINNLFAPSETYFFEFCVQ